MLRHGHAIVELLYGNPDSLDIAVVGEVCLHELVDPSTDPSLLSGTRGQMRLMMIASAEFDNKGQIDIAYREIWPE
jgi:hypothetical protein